MAFPSDLDIARAATLAPLQRAVAAGAAEIEALEAAYADPAKAPLALRGAVKSAESNVESAQSKARPFPDTSTGRRTALANWVADPKNPLTARVAVNHVWLRHFGAPLVPNVFELGRKGAPPSHPELLDWLAVEFMESGWDVKHVMRLMVRSAAYKRDSRATPEMLAKDPENRTLARTS